MCNRISKESNEDEPYVEISRLTNLALAKWNEEPKRCVVCGTKTKTTTDHIPPKGIFVDNRDDMITIRACSACQKTPDDEFIDTLSFLLPRKELTESGQSLIDKVERKLKKRSPSSQYLQAIRDKYVGEISLENRSGSIVLPTTSEPVVTVPQQFLLPVLVKITSGLFWLFTRGRLLTDCPGRVILCWNIDLNSDGIKNIFSESFRSSKTGKGQFMGTHIQFHDAGISVPFAMSMHFHAKPGHSEAANSGYGYNVLAFLLLDEFRELPNPHINEVMDGFATQFPEDRILAYHTSDVASIVQKWKQ